MQSATKTYKPKINSWSNTKIECLLKGEFELGRTYRVHILDTATNSVKSNHYSWKVNTQITTPPKKYQVGESVGISGCLLGAAKGNRKLIVGGKNAAITQWDCEDIVFTVPQLAPDTYKMFLKEGRLIISNTVNIKIIAALMPKIKKVWLEHDDCQMFVNLNGTNFGNVIGNREVRLKKAANQYTPVITSWSNTKIRSRLTGEFKLGLTYKVYIWDIAAASAQSNKFAKMIKTKISISNKKYQPGQSIGISGHLLGAAAGNRKVMIGNTQAIITDWCCEDIVITIPQLAPGTYKMRLKQANRIISNIIPIKII